RWSLHVMAILQQSRFNAPRDVRENPFPLFGCVWNRTATRRLDSLEGVFAAPSKSHKNRNDKYGGPPDTGTAMDSNKSSFLHHLSQLLNVLQEVVPVRRYGAVGDRQIFEADC